MIIGGVFATGLWAACPAGQEMFTACHIEDRGTEVSICFDDQVATYRYGPIGGAADLVLSEPIETVDFEPWSGVGRAISESITFYNGDYAYDVGGGFDRPMTDEEANRDLRRFGWVLVTESGLPAASLTCIPDTVGYGFGGGIYDLKRARGLEWDQYSYTWVADQFTNPPILSQNLHFDVPEDCVPPEEFGLGGVMMGDPLAALGKLGSPEAIEAPPQSGRIVDRMTLIGMHLDIERGVVAAMSTTSPRWEMPSGLRVGLTRGEAIRILGRVPNGYFATSERFYIHQCLDKEDSPEGWGILIEFGHDKRVRSINFLSPSY